MENVSGVCMQNVMPWGWLSGCCYAVVNVFCLVGQSRYCLDPSLNFFFFSCSNVSSAITDAWWEEMAFDIPVFYMRRPALIITADFPQIDWGRIVHRWVFCINGPPLFNTKPSPSHQHSAVRINQADCSSSWDPRLMRTRLQNP